MDCLEDWMGCNALKIEQGVHTVQRLCKEHSWTPNIMPPCSPIPLSCLLPVYQLTPQHSTCWRYTGVDFIIVTNRIIHSIVPLVSPHLFGWFKILITLLYPLYPTA